VREATEDEQRNGVDLVLDERLRVEVKAQFRPGYRFFVETRAPGLAAPGWALGSEADIFVLVDSAARFCVAIRAERLRSRIYHWVDCFGESPGRAPTHGRARTSGIWVPWSSLEAASGLFWLDVAPPELEKLP
jgi:hypothetical protein